MPRYFRQPKVRTLNGKKYKIYGVTQGAKPMAIAQFYTKYGYKDVKNLSIRVQLAKKL